MHQNFHIYHEAEKIACEILNSPNLPIPSPSWKKDFKRVDHSDYDLVNSQCKRIEVKSTLQWKQFSANATRFNSEWQRIQVIMKQLLDSDGKVLMFKFVIKQKEKWYNATQLVLGEGPLYENSSEMRIPYIAVRRDAQNNFTFDMNHWWLFRT